MKRLIIIGLLFTTGLFVISQNAVIMKDDNGNTLRSRFNPHVKEMLNQNKEGNEWNSLGPYGGDVLDIAVSPIDTSIVIAAAGFPYISNDGGSTWQIMENLFSLAPSGIGSVEINSDGVMFASGPYIYYKIFRSSDNGLTWQQKSTPVNGAGLDITIDPGDPNTVYVGLTSVLGASANNVIIKSSNLGDNWSYFNLINVLPVGYSVVNLTLDPDDSQTIFAIGNAGISDALVAASFDGGATWENRTGNLPTGKPYNSLTISQQTVYLAGGQLFGGQNVGIYSTADYGQSWQNISTTFPNKVSNAILIDPTNTDKMYVATEGDGVYYTTNGGSSWNFSTTGAGDNGAARCLAFEPGNTDVIYAGFLSLAACRSTNGGQAWNYANKGIATLQTDDIDIDPTNPNKVLVGFEAENSGGCYLSNDGGATWGLVAGLPGTRFSQVKFGSDGALYAWSNGPSSIAQEGLYKSTDGGTVWVNKGPNIGGLFETEIFSLATSDTDPDLIFIGGNNFGANGWESMIYRTTDGGDNWVNEYMGNANDSFRFLFIDPNSNDQIAYSAYKTETDHGGFMKSTDVGVTWNFINTGLPGSAKWGGAIVCDPVNSDIVYAGLGGYGGLNAKIFISTDGGDNWTSTANSLSSYSKFTDILVSPANSDVLYAATSLDGVYISTDAGITWEPANDGLPAANVTGFSHAFMADDIWKFCASTFSNSTFITDIFDVNTSIRSIDLSGIKVRAFPNPSSGSIFINLTIEKASNLTVSLYTMQGQLVRNIVKANFQKGNYHYVINEKQGEYILVFKLGKSVKSKKIIIL